MEDRPTDTIKIAHILEATIGGTRRWLEEVLPSLNHGRIENSCICSLRRDRTFEATIRQFQQRGIRTWIVDMRRELSPLHDLQALVCLYSVFRDNSFDIIHAHSAKAGMLVRIAARFLRPRPLVIYTPHAFPFLAGGLTGHFYWYLEKLARRLTDKLMAVSESEAILALELGYQPENVKAICNGVSPQEYEVPVCKHGVLPQIGFAGRLVPQKDPLTFVNACNLVNQVKPNVRFVVCGSGPLFSRAHSLVTELGLDSALDFQGWRSQPEQSMSSWDVCVLTSRYEGLPYVLLDAMALGKPIVATRAPGIVDVIRDGENGLLVDVGNHEAVAKAAMTLLDHPQLAAELGVNARQTILRGYTKDQQVKEVETFYRVSLANLGT